LFIVKNNALLQADAFLRANIYTMPATRAFQIQTIRIILNERLKYYFKSIGQFLYFRNLRYDKRADIQFIDLLPFYFNLAKLPFS